MRPQAVCPPPRARRAPTRAPWPSGGLRGAPPWGCKHGRLPIHSLVHTSGQNIAPPQRTLSRRGPASARPRPAEEALTRTAGRMVPTPLWGASGLGRRLPRWGDPVSAPAFGDADDPGILVRFPDRRLLTEHLRCSYSSSVRHTGPDWGLIPGSKIKIKQNFGTFSSFSSRGCFW